MPGVMASVDTGRQEIQLENAGNDDEFMLLNEVAELTRLPPSTLRWMRHQGKGPPCVKAGRRLLYRRSGVMAWISELEREQQQEGAR